ncbi:hypothetical protein AZ66_10910 [Paenibacillus sp. E194]|nr:hypothetical protein AZ66_10910 [Paenibacillus sp. E194]
MNLTLGLYDANGKVVGWPASGSMNDDTKGEFFVLSTNGVVPQGAIRAAVQVNIIGVSGKGATSVIIDDMNLNYAREHSYRKINNSLRDKNTEKENSLSNRSAFSVFKQYSYSLG